MTETKFTPKPWRVRKHIRQDELIDCFVEADDVNGYAYNAEILGDDEYHDGIERKLADCNLIAAAPYMFEVLEKIVEFGKRSEVPLCTGLALQITKANEVLKTAKGEE